MGWEDRSYYRDRGGELRSPFWFLLFGSVPMFTLAGIRVRAHMSLILFVALNLLFGGIGYKSYGWQVRLESMAVLFAIILLHEYGHCFASRWVGGDPEQIILSPLGGLAMTQAPHRPGATLIAVAGGPAVNLLICLVTALTMFALSGAVPWFPLKYAIPHGWLNVYGYLFWIYSISLALLVFNLLPIFPLDGGQLVQAGLWFKLGYYRPMNIACIVGYVGGGMLAVFGFWVGNLLLVFIALSGLATCYMMRRQLREAGADSEYGTETLDFSASLRPDPPKKRRRTNTWAMRRLRREAQQEAAEQLRIDSILAKVSAKGMASLTWSERRALRRATARQRQRDLELSRLD